MGQSNQRISVLTSFLSSGDNQAFHKLYATYYPVFISYGKAMSNDRELTKDTIQNLFVWMWQNHEKIAKMEQPENYLFTAFRNNLLSAQLKLKNQQNLLNQQFRSNNEASPNEEIVLEEPVAPVNSYLHQLLENLPTKQKEVIYLRFYQEKSFSEIAEIMSISTQVAQNYALRALTKLRQHAHHLEKLIYPLMALFVLGF
ncbi:MAG: RNA polymerase sigma factor [Saprospiraceae bacterium]